MRTDNTYLNNIQINGNFQKKTAEHKEYSAGDLLSAVISEKRDGKTSLLTETGDTLKIKSGYVKGEVGDKVLFEITEDGKDLKMRQVLPKGSGGEEKTSVKQAETKAAKELLADLGYAEPETDEQGGVKTNKQAYSEERIKAAQAEAKIKNAMSGVVNNATNAAVAYLAASGVNVANIPLDLLNELTAQIKNNKLITVADAQDYGEKPLPDPALNAAADKIEAVKTMSDAQIAFAVKNAESGKPLTLDAAYAARFARADERPEIDADALTAEIEQFFESNGIEKTERNLSAAKLLLSFGGEISQKSIDAVIALKSINSADLLQKAAQAIKDGKKTGDVALTQIPEAYGAGGEFNELVAEYAEIMEYAPKMQNVSAWSITELKRSERLTISGVLEEIKTLAEQRVALPIAPLTEISPQIYADKKTILEISIKLTYASAAVLISKNISISTLPLEVVLSEINAAQKEAAAQSPIPLPAYTEEAAQIMEGVKTLDKLPVSYYGAVLSANAPLTIKAAYNAKYTDVFGDFAHIQTAPNARYGDSFEKAEAHLPALLASLGYDATEDNLRAVKILSLNGIIVNDENMARVKLADQKLNRVYRKLHPAIAAKMVEDDFDAAERSLDDILDYIEEFDGEFGENTRDKLARYIFDMERSGVVSDANRSEIMSLYNALNKILKNGASSVGSALKAEKRLTIANLYELAKASERGVDITFSGEDVYVKNAVRNLADSAEPTALNGVLNDTARADFLNMTVAELIEKLEAYAAQNPSGKSSVSRDLTGVPAGAAALMQKAGVPLTAENLAILKTLLKKPSFAGKTIRELCEEGDEIRAAFSEAATDSDLTELRGEQFSDITRNYEIALDNMSQKTEAISQSARINAIRRGNEITERILGDGKAQAGKQRAYASLPIKLNGEITEINMYVVNNNAANKSDLNILFALNTNKGFTAVSLTTSGKSVTVKISADNRAFSEELSQNAARLTEYVRDAGYILNDVVFEENENVSFLSSAMKEE
ncbi:hypothetical protein FACS189490_05450 [Clostridia bacterium]|nr:hypothetical protein FACS189490_05450 [Clostridia bacterium]